MKSFSNALNRILKPAIVALSLVTLCSTFVRQVPAEPTTTTTNLSHPHYVKFGEWRYQSGSNPPTLLWWNDRMSDIVPTLYITFTSDNIVMNAVTPSWPDIGILFYIKDKSEKQGINLTLQRKDPHHNYYSAIIDKTNAQNFINNLVTSHKARLITPSSYSQSLSLNHVDQAMKFLLKSNPNLRFTLPQVIQSSH